MLKHILNITTWLPEYGRADLRSDLVAGLTVGVMLIPQGMAYALLAGLPPIYGLYASLVPLLVYPLFGTSRHLAVGTVALDMMIVAVGVGALAEPGTDRYVGLAILLAMMVGVFQILMGLGRLGFIVTLLSRPVIVGFTSAAALIIGTSQLGNLLGVVLSRSQYVTELVWEAAQHLSDVHLLTLAVGGGAIVLLVALQRWVRVLPGALVVVALGIGLAWGLDLESQGVEVVGTIPTGLPTPDIPAISTGMLRDLLPTVFTLVLVQFMSVVSLGKVFAARHNYTIDANKELVAIGAANFLGSFARSIPVSGSFSRTAVNERAGVHTALANVFAAVLIALTLLFLTPLFYYLPIPILAAIIIVAAFGLLDVEQVRYLLRAKRVDGVLAIVTFFATFLIGVQEGIMIGVGGSVIAIMYRISRPNVVILGHLPGTRSFGDVERNPKAEQIGGILMIRVDASFSFANADLVEEFILEKTEEGEIPIRAVIIDASSMNDLDMTAVAMLHSVAESLEERGIDLYFGGVKGPVRDVMVRSGLRAALGEDRFFLSPHRAVKHLLEAWDRAEGYLDRVPGEPLDEAEEEAERASWT